MQEFLMTRNMHVTSDIYHDTAYLCKLIVIEAHIKILVVIS